MADSFLPPVVAVLMANVTQFKAGMAEAGTSMAALKEEGSLASFGGMTTGLMAAGAAAIAVGGYAIKSAADFETATTRLTSAAGETKANIGLVSQGILDMAGQVGFTAQKLAQSMYVVDSAGFHGADSLTVLKAAAEGARIEQADLGTTVDAVTTSLVDYHLGADQAANVMSKLVAAVGEGKTNLQELAGSLHSVTPLAANLGITLDEVTAAVATMTVHGMSADQATQNLADTIRHLSNPTQTMISEMGQLGLSSQKLSQQLGDPSVGLHGVLEEIYSTIMQHMGPAGQVLLGTFKQSTSAAGDLSAMVNAMPAQLKGLAQGLEDGSVTLEGWRKGVKSLPADMAGMASQFLALYEKASGFNDALKSGSPAAQTFEAALAKIMGDSTGLNTALMLGGENAGRFADNIKTIGSASADAQGNVKNWADVQATLNQKLADLEGSASSSAVKIGNELLPAVKGLLDFINSHYNDLDNFQKTLDKSAGSAHDFLSGMLNDFNNFGNSLFGENSDIGKWVSKWVLGIQSSSDRMGPFAKSAGAAVGAKFADGVNGTTPQVVDAAGKLVTSLSGPLGLLTTTTYVEGVFAGTHFSDGIDSSQPAVSAASGDLVGTAQAEMDRLQSKAGIAANSAGNQFADSLSSTKSNVAGAAGDLAGSAWSEMQRLQSKADMAGVLGGSHYASGIASTLPQVSSAAGRLAAAGEDPLNGLGGAAYASGTSIGYNIAAGIRNSMGAVAEASTAMATIVRNHMPSSPAKVGPLSGSGSPDILGRNIGLMIANGIASTGSPVAGAMSNILGGTSSAAYTVSSSSGGRGGGLNLYATMYVDSRELKNAIQKVTLREERVNTSNGLSRTFTTR